MFNDMFEEILLLFTFFLVTASPEVIFNSNIVFYWFKNYDLDILPNEKQCYLSL